MKDWLSFATVAHVVYRAQQNIGELTQVLTLLDERGVSSIVEIGVGEGGSLWAWRQLPGPPRVVAISAPVPGPQWVKIPDGVDFAFADSHTVTARAWVEMQLREDGGDGLCDVLFIDGDHSYAGCAADFDDYSPLVRAGGLVLVHDIAFECGVTEWWTQAEAVYTHRSRSIIGPGGPGTGDNVLGFGVIEV